MNFVDVFDQLANVAQVARKCPTPVLRRAYVRAMRDWCQQTRWLRVTIAGSSVVGQQMYNLGGDPYIEIVGVQAMSGTDNSTSTPQSFPIGPGVPSSWNPNRPNGQPFNYTYVPEAQFSLFPIPDKVYGLTVSVIVQPKEGASQVPETPLMKYSTEFESGALAYLLAMKDTTWFDPVRAEKAEREFRAGVANGKAEVQRNYNDGAQRAIPRRFLT